MLGRTLVRQEGEQLLELVERTRGLIRSDREAAAARRRGADVEIVGPDADSARAMGADLMSPRRRAAALDAGFKQGARTGAQV